VIVLGLTGSIGMGKSTTAQMFADAGAPWSGTPTTPCTALRPGGAAVEPVGEAFPGVVVDGAVDRTRLAEAWAATTPPSNGWRPSSIRWSPQGEPEIWPRPPRAA
jgi:dephospho-CoA kinase